MTTTKFYFIHGYGSGEDSSKYQKLKEYFGERFQMKCVVWKTDSNIPLLLKEVISELENDKKPILFGDSTGANFAFQIRKQLLKKGNSPILILTSPLLDFSKRIWNGEFAKNIEQSLIQITEPENALIIVPEHDEVIDQNRLMNYKKENVVILKTDDDHRLSKFKEDGNLLKDIEQYIENQLSNN